MPERDFTEYYRAVVENDQDRNHLWSLVVEAINEECPLAPVSIRHIVPVIKHLGSDTHQHLLEDILKSPDDWQIVTGADRTIARSLVIAPEDAPTLYLEGRQLGETGEALTHLTLLSPAIHLLQEVALTLHHLEIMSPLQGDQPDDQTDNELADLKIAFEAILNRYLNNAKENEIRLAIEQLRMPSYHLLFESLGYYALLDPDETRSSNEPVPFTQQRLHLKRIRRQLALDEVVQRDRIFKEAFSDT